VKTLPKTTTTTIGIPIPRSRLVYFDATALQLLADTLVEPQNNESITHGTSKLDESITNAAIAAQVCCHTTTTQST
jgi:hypothetical protein